MITQDMLPKWLEPDPTVKDRVVFLYCRRHKIWYWPPKGCECCAADKEKRLKGRWPDKQLYIAHLSLLNDNRT